MKLLADIFHLLAVPLIECQMPDIDDTIVRLQTWSSLILTFLLSSALCHRPSLRRKALLKQKFDIACQFFPRTRLRLHKRAYILHFGRK